MDEIATRRERVILDLEDNFTTKMARAAASASLLHRELDSLSGSAVRSHAVQSVSRDIDTVGTSSRRASSDIDRFSGRLGLLRDIALTIGPAFVPIGAIAVPAVAGLAAQAGALALAGGTVIAAFQGMGDALEAVNEAQLEPTAENLEEARIAMEALSPQAQELVRQIQAMRPALGDLRDAAGEGLFPGVGDALGDLEGVLPNLERLLSAVGSAAGSVAAEFGEGIAGPRGQEFIDFLAAEVPRAVSDLGRTVGNLSAGLAELWMAFTPLNRDFSTWLLGAARDFDTWASGLSQTQGFRDFIDYIRENGPRVADAMGAIGNAVLQVVQAAAPLGGPTLAALEAVADVIAAIANSQAGTALIALAAGVAVVNRSLRAMDALRASNLFQTVAGGADGATRSLSRMERVAVGAAGALVGLSVVDALQGGLEDYSIGVESMTSSILELQSGVSGDLPRNLEGIANSIDRLANPGRAEALQDTISNALGGIGNEEEYDRAIAQIESLDAALTGLVQEGNKDVAQDFVRGLNLSESQLSDLMSLLPGYRDALAGVENQSRLTGDAASAASRRAAQGFSRAAGAAQRFRTAIEAANRVLEGRSSMRDYEQAIDDLTRSVRANGRNLDINTQKGRDNQAALDAIASTALAVAENMRGTNRVDFLRRARQDMIDAAQRLGMTRAEARQLADQLGLVDKIRANPKIEVDTGSARSDIQSVESWLNSIQDEIVYVNVQRRGGGVQKYDTGGYTGPGHRLEPRGIVHAGEVVIPKHLVERDWWMLRARYGHLPGFADGGLVGATRQQQTSTSVSVSAPSVAVGGTSVRVYLGNREVSHLARVEIDDQRGFDRIMEGR